MMKIALEDQQHYILFPTISELFCNGSYKSQ